MARLCEFPRDGKVLVLLVVALPVLIGVVGLIVDGGALASQQRRLQQAVDSAATAAATDLRLGGSAATATAVAIDYVTLKNKLTTANVVVHTPPTTVPYAGNPEFVEIESDLNEPIGFFHVLDGVGHRGVRARSVAGVAEATAGAAIVILDSSPAAFSAASAASALSLVNLTSLTAELPLAGPLSSVGLGGLLNSARTSVSSLLAPVLTTATSQLTLPALPTLIAGLEVEGVGRLMVEGAIHVNTAWGGVDENGNAVGESAPLPYAIACMPVAPTTRIYATDVRVVGGVDNPELYQPLESDGAPPLRANRLPVADPLEGLPVPSTAADSSVTSVVQGGHCVAVNVLSVQSVMQPLLGGLWPVLKATLETLLEPSLVTTPLQPGVYDSITVVSLGEVRFEPGVYIIRGKSPITQMSLAAIGGWINADGVMFYITDSANFSAATGAPDSSDPSTSSPTNELNAALPSVLIAPLLPGSIISGLNAPGSPFDEILLYQRRNDRRPLVLAATQLVGGGHVAGIVYAKWGHVAFIGGPGSYDLRFVCGTMRVLTAFETRLSPSSLFPPAKDVFLVE